MRPRTRIVLATAATIGVIAIGFTSFGARAVTAHVEEGELRDRIVARAVVVPVNGVAEVRARMDGQVSSVFVREGQHVRKGQILAEIEPVLVASELSKRRAELRSLDNTAKSVAAGARVEERRALDAELRATKEERDASRRRQEREERLAQNGVNTPEVLEESRRGLKVAEARVEAAEARLDLGRAGGRVSDVRAAKARVAAAEAGVKQAEEELDKTKIRSPIEGTLLARRIDPGDTIGGSGAGVGAAQFEIADLSRTELRVEVEELDAARLATGLRVEILDRSTHASLGNGTIDRVGARLERRTIGASDARERGEGWVRSAWVELSGTALILPVGCRPEVVIELPSRHVQARVPRDAVQIRDGYAYVDVSSTLGWRAARVELGAADQEYVEVSGVHTGAKVRVRH